MKFHNIHPMCTPPYWKLSTMEDGGAFDDLLNELALLGWHKHIRRTTEKDVNGCFSVTFKDNEIKK